MNKELLHILLSNPKLKNHFFTDVDGVLVFDKNKFTWTIENKEFLPDSYTRFKQKIGLIDSNERFISSNNDVVLSFPYKDCVLEGGQTKEDQQRSEIFFNETLAPEDVDCLLAPKVFTNIKKYTKDGEESVSSISLSDNLLIKGNNLLALSSLQKRYQNKVKLIYIDPPYNTGNDSFGYNDSFNHSTWLVFMKNRLEISKRLLREDGVICIQCDDNEQAYLKVLCDDIFERANFVNSLAVEMSPSSGMKRAHKDKCFIKNKESILIYKREQCEISPLFNPWTTFDSHYSIYFDGNEYTSLLKKLRSVFPNIKNLTISEFLKIEDIKKFIINNSNRIFRTHSPSKWCLDNATEGEILFNGEYQILKVRDPKKEGEYEIIKSKVSKNGKKGFDRLEPLSWNVVDHEICTLRGDLWLDYDKDMGNINDEGEIAKFGNGKKPERLIKDIIESLTAKNDLVLDYHLGSGTTAAVAHKLGRQYIGIEQMDYIKTFAVNRLKNVIYGEQSGISQLANWKGGGSFVYCELKELNQEYVKQIQNVESDHQLIELYNIISKSKFINSKLKPSNIESNVSDFESLSTESKRKLLIKLLDLNMLYVNYSDIDDEEYQVSGGDKSFNRSFYGD